MPARSGAVGRSARVCVRVCARVRVCVAAVACRGGGVSPRCRAALFAWQLFAADVTAAAAGARLDG